ncbi:MAG: EAL domain-containing protein, partial [Spirochaetes bacterium]|nr:EAL domain-containing protein [Spirochaetota bacterium]
MKNHDRLITIISQNLNLDEAFIKNLQHSLSIDEQDKEIITRIQQLITNAPDQLWDEFHTYLKGINSFKKFFDNFSFIKNHTQALNDYFKRFASSTPDNDYILNRLKVGIQLEKYDVNPILFSTSYGNVYSYLLEYIKNSINDDSLLAPVVKAYMKIVFLDLALILYAYFFVKDKKLSESKKELAHVTRSYRLIHEINDLIIRTNDEKALFENTVKILVALGNFDLAWIGIVDNDLKVVPVASCGKTEYLDNIFISVDPAIPEGNGPVGTAIREKITVRINYPDEDPRYAPWKERAHKYGFKSIISMPIVPDEQHDAIGAITLYSCHENFVSLGEAAMLQEVANDLSFAIRNIRRDKEYEAILFTDTLTGLGNVHYFTSMLSSQMKVASQQNVKLAIVTIDIDNFTAINNSIGYLQGDKILQEFGKRISQLLHNSHLVARSSDEFYTIFPFTDDMELINFIDDLKRLSMTPFDDISNDLMVTYCIGIAVFPGDGNNADDVVHKSRVALSEAKKIGYGTVCYYSEQLFQKNIKKISLQQELRAALKNNEFELYYQPTINLTTRQISGLEALIRWHHPKRGMLAPSHFISVLESSDIIIQVGRWIIAEVSRQVQITPQLQQHGFTVSFNVSPAQFYDSNFIVDVIKSVKSSMINPSHLQIEVTENLL